MNTNDITPEVEEELKELIIDALNDGYDGYVCDLHNRVFNEDYFIIGTYAAEQWLIKNYGIFDAMDKIKEYEQFNFREVNTDLSSPESVVNMLVYILGEEIMQEIDSITDNWDEEVTDEIRKVILAELKDEEVEEAES